MNRGLGQTVASFAISAILRVTDRQTVAAGFCPYVCGRARVHVRSPAITVCLSVQGKTRTYSMTDRRAGSLNLRALTCATFAAVSAQDQPARCDAEEFPLSVAEISTGGGWKVCRAGPRRTAAPLTRRLFSGSGDFPGRWNRIVRPQVAVERVIGAVSFERNLGWARTEHRAQGSGDTFDTGCGSRRGFAAGANIFSPFSNGAF